MQLEQHDNCACLWRSLIFSVTISVYDNFYKYGKSNCTEGQGILNLLQLSSLVKNYCKIWKIKPCKSGEFRTLFYHERKSVLLCGNVVMLLARNKNVHRIRKIHIRIFSALNYILQRSFTILLNL